MKSDKTLISFIFTAEKEFLTSLFVLMSFSMLLQHWKKKLHLCLEKRVDCLYQVGQWPTY
jgi:hypothetical protein